MNRLGDQRKAHALCMLAENERYLREAIEAGCRQRGDNRRRTHDEIVRNVQLVKHNTIAEYLEDVLINCMDRMAEKSAREQIRDVVRQIDEEAEDPTPLRVVTGILNRFVMPAVFTRIARENYLADVHESLFIGTVPDMLSDHKRSRMNRFLASAVSAKGDHGDGISPISSLDSLADPAHHEAMRCVEIVIKRAFQGTKQFDRTGTYGIIDDIIQSVIPDDNESQPRTDRSSQQLTEIVTDLNNQLWEAVETVDNKTVKNNNEAKQPYNETTNATPRRYVEKDSIMVDKEAALGEHRETLVWKLGDDIYAATEDSGSTVQKPDDVEENEQAEASSLEVVSI